MRMLLNYCFSMNRFLYKCVLVHSGGDRNRGVVKCGDENRRRRAKTSGGIVSLSVYMLRVFQCVSRITIYFFVDRRTKTRLDYTSLTVYTFPACPRRVWLQLWLLAKKNVNIEQLNPGQVIYIHRNWSEEKQMKRIVHLEKDSFEH